MKWACDVHTKKYYHNSNQILIVSETPSSPIHDWTYKKKQVGLLSSLVKNRQCSEKQGRAPGKYLQLLHHSCPTPESSRTMLDKRVLV